MTQEQITLRILHHEDIAITMEAGVSLFFGLHGQYTIATAHESCAIHSSEVYAVSPFTLYRVLGGEDAGLLQITLSSEILQRAEWQEKQQISCYLTRDSLKDALAQEVRRRCAAVFRLYFQQTNQPELMRQAVELAALLRREFAAVEAARPEESINALKLLESALQTIHTRWKQAVTLPEVAAQLYVSESYLSRLFKKYLGKTFTKYLVELRLTHAAADLQSGLITYFYTNVMSVSAAMVGMIMLISRIFDGVSDVAIGLIMDKVHSKHGRGRAWVLWMALPYGISAVALFCLPSNATEMVQAIYIIITYNLCTTVVYTALNLPYGAMAPLMTSNEQDLAKINLFRMAMSPIGNTIVSAASLPIINRMGGA